MKKFLLLVLSLMVCATASASVIKIDMEAIKKIESGGDPHAWNTKSNARGLYQITPICLKEFNMFTRNAYTMDDMFDGDMCFEVANWYLHDRIPDMLDYYCTDNAEVKELELFVIICYNWGIGNFLQWRGNGKIFDELPMETRCYYESYVKTKSNKF